MAEWKVDVMLGGRRGDAKPHRALVKDNVGTIK